MYDERGGLFVEARVGRADAVRMILDTGASRTTLSSAFAAELGLIVRSGEDVTGSAGRVSAGQAVVDIEVPGLERLAIDCAVYDFASYDSRCVGILGYEYLRRAPFRVRFRARELLWRASPPARTTTMTLDGRIPRVAASIMGQRLELRIDTGATLAPSGDVYLNLTAGQAEALRLGGEPVKVFKATGTGDATLTLPVHRLTGLEVNGVRFAEAFAIVQPRIGYFARPEAVGFLGNSVLDKLDPFFDYERGLFGSS